MQKKKEIFSDESQSILGRALNFTRGDLEANRAGFLSNRQARRVWREKFLYFLGAIFGCLFFIFVGIMPAWSLFQDPDVSIWGKIIFIPVVIVLGLFMFVCSLLFAWMTGLAFREMQDKEKNRRVHKLIVRKSSKEFALESNLGSLFPVSDDVYNTIQYEQLYCMYYFDGDNGLRIYSVEPYNGEFSQIIAGHDFANFEDEGGTSDAKEKRSL